MTTLTIRITDDLKQRASRKAERMGLPLTFIVENALRDFLSSSTLTISDPEDVEVTPAIQAKMDLIGKALLNKRKKNNAAHS